MTPPDLLANQPASEPLVPEALLRRYDTPTPRYTSYPPVPAWSEAIGPADHAEALRQAGREADALLSLYVHVPFCRSLCAYCGCNVVVTRDRTAVDAYLDDVGRELALVVAQLGARRTLGQVHWGGGTPTSLDERQLEVLWGHIGAHFRLSPGAEFAVEIDPRVTTRSQLAVLRGLGVSRLSLGVQDLDAQVQEAIGRHQGPEDTQIALEAARALRFAGVNFDLVYGLPGQTTASWERTLADVVALGPDRVALYSFAHVPDVRTNQRRLPVSLMPTGRDKLELFLQARRAFLRAGYRAIGMDHFARPGDALARAEASGRLRRNFQGYTAIDLPDVVAVGATAISDVGGVYAQNTRPLPRYHDALAARRFATVRGFRLGAEDRRRRAVIQDLMCRFSADLGPDPGRTFGPELAGLAPLVDDGLARLEGSRLEVTPLGRLFVRNIAMVFDAYQANPQRLSRTV